MSTPAEGGRARDPFPTTLWTQIVDGARSGADPARSAASWSRFLRAYRQPIERALRAHLHAPALRARSAELVDEFFSHLAAGDVLARADRERGSFRRFIQGVVRNFVLERLRSDQRWRGGDPALLATLGSVDDTVDSADERQWFAGMVHAALGVLAADNPRQARAIALRFGIGEDAGHGELPPAAIASRLQATPHAVHELLRRAKIELQKILARAVADSVHASTAAEYRQAFERERARLHERVASQWPGILAEDADG